MRKIDRLKSRGPLTVLLGALGATALAGGAIAANPVPVPTAKITGGTGTYTDAKGGVFAKTGQPVTLEVGGTNVNCVVYDGVTDVQAPFTFTLNAPVSEGLHSVQATAWEGTNGKNCTKDSAGVGASYTVDNSAPQVSAQLSSPAVNGWHNRDVTLTWGATDIAGVKSGPTPATDTVTTNTPVTKDTDGVIKTSEATDNLGHTGKGSQQVRLDKLAPTITAALTPKPNEHGWNNADVSVSFSCADQLELSGVAECPSSATTVKTEGANQPVSGTVKDVAGNSASTTARVSIDKIAPTLGGTPQGTPLNGWYNGDVTIAWSCADTAGSGVVACPEPTLITGEGSGLTSTRTISDKAGNQRTASSDPAVKIDRTAPTTTATAPSGWTNADAKVLLAGHDGASGVEATHYTVDGGAKQTYSSTEGITFSEEGDHALTFWSVDKAGNAEPATTIRVKVDRTAPTIGHTLSPEPNPRGWNNADVTVSFQCADAGGSGIASCTETKVVTTQGASQKVEGEARDHAGNSALDTATVSLDKTKPTIAAAADRRPNGAGWYNDDVIVSFTCADQDGLSGVDTCPAPVTLGAGKGQTVSRSVLDVAGNEASAGVSGINVDKRAPTITGSLPQPNANGWYAADVQVAWACADEGGDQSGVADDACPGPSTVTGEGDALGVSASVADRAGNEAKGTASGIKIDRTAPITRADLPEAVANGWYAGPVEIRLPATDNLSGVAATHYSIDGGVPRDYQGPFTFDQNGAHTLTFWSMDKAGNPERATTVDVKVDTKNPTIAGSRPAANANGWYNGSVGVTFACADEDSGVKSCTDGVTLSDEGAGQSVTGKVEDLVGNTATTKVEGIDIDLTAPTVTGKATTAPNAHGWYAGDVTIGWTCTETLSGLDGSCPANSTITGEGADLGATTATVFDRAGNESQSGSIGGIKIDRAAPAVAITSPQSGSTVPGDSVSVSATAGDELSGVDGVAINGAAAVQNTDGSFSRSVPLSCGANTITAVSRDRAGNASGEQTISVTRSCMTAGHALAPIATGDGSQTNAKATNLSAFKIKSVVPVKFQVFLDSARTQLMTSPPAGSTARLSMVKTDSTTDSSDTAELVSGTANTGDVFRWSATDNQYVYNLSTSGKSAGTYAVTLTLYGADGSVLAQSVKQHFVLRS